MAQNPTTTPAFEPLRAATTGAATVALRSARAELEALPASEVRHAPRELLAVLREHFDRVAAAKAAAGERDARLARLEGLVLAAARAQHDFLWAPPGRPVANYATLVANAERCFDAVEELAARQVRLGTVARADLPRTGRAGQIHQRCERVLLLVEVLRESGLVAHELRRAESFAERVVGARPAADSLTPMELRDRAFTLMALAFEAHPWAGERAEPEHSGVFEVADLVGPELAREAALARCA